MFKKVHRIGREWAEAAYNLCFNRPIGYIYMFHMVCPKTDLLSPIDDLRVSPEFFEAFLTKQQKRVDFISIDDVPFRMTSHKRGNKPFGVITFDDGYEDNFTYAYPILKKLGIPFVIYVSSGLVKDHTPIWNFPLIIERVVKKNSELDINGIHYVSLTPEQKNETFLKLKGLLFSLPYEKMLNKFKQLFAEYLADDIFPKNTLTWQQIEELSKDSLCTIGCHTMTHCRLTITDTNALEYELLQSKNVLAKHTGKSVEHLSYPYGWKSDVSDAAIDYAKKSGYKTALRSFGGPIRKKDTDLYQLKRIMIHE